MKCVLHCLLLTLFLSSCHRPDTPSGQESEVVAVVGDEKITIDFFSAEMRRRKAPNSAEARTALLAELVEHKKLLHRAKERRYLQDPEVQRQIEALLVSKVRGQAEAELASVTVEEQAIQTYYNAHLDQYRTPERVRVAKIVVTVPAGANEATRAAKRAKIDEAHAAAAEQGNAGKHFGALAVTYSEDQVTRYRGGDMGYFLSQEMASEEAEVIRGLSEVGALSNVVETPEGYVFYRLLERNPKSLRPLKAVRGAIQGKLITQAKEDRQAQLLSSLTEGISTTIYSDVLHAIQVESSFPEKPSTPPAIAKR